jgi:hypothetical protein
VVAALQETAATCEDVPIVIGDEEIRTNDVRYQVMVSQLNVWGALLAINWAQFYHIKEKLNYPYHSLSDDIKNGVYLELMEWWSGVPIDMELEQGREKR